MRLYERETVASAGNGSGEVEMSRGGRRLMENGEGEAVRKEVASRNCQSAGILPSHRGGGTRHASTEWHAALQVCGARESVMNSLMKWVWRLRVTRWVRCHFRRGCGAAVSYGAGSDNEISASSLAVVSLSHHAVTARLYWQGSSS